MLKIMVEKWDKNKARLEEKLKNMQMTYEYKDLVKITFEQIYNYEERNWEMLNTKDITEIDNGDYQGTLLYLIPFKTYQPTETEYLMTYVGYGSCSGCDTLLGITGYDTEKLPNKKQLKELMMLCKDIIQNTIKPYNYGWRNDGKFDTETVD